MKAKLSFVACALIVAWTVRAQDTPLADLSGIWQLSGEDGDQAYHGVLLIEQQDDGKFRVLSATLSGSARGVGIRKGDVLSVAWVQPQGDALVIGLTVYTIKDGGKTLEGEWRTLGPGKSPRTERAKWLAKLKASET